MHYRERSRAPGSTRDWLRSATAEDHASTDAVFGAFDFARPDAFARFLLAQQAGLAAAETELRAHGACRWSETVARRLDAICEDLDSLGAKTTFTVPLRTPEPIGIAYVVAGSLHGTSVLRTRYRKLNPDAPLPRFFEAGDWKPMWADALSALERHGQNPAILTSARATFDAFTRAGEIATMRSRLEPAA